MEMSDFRVVELCDAVGQTRPIMIFVLRELTGCQRELLLLQVHSRLSVL